MERLSSGPASDAVQDQVIIGQTGVDKEHDCCSLTYKQRLIGFLICFLLGVILSFMSLFGVLDLVINPTKFAVIYSLGNVLSIGSTLFLWGPKKQCKGMFETTDRGIATAVFVSCILATIMLCIFYPKWYLVLIFIIIQFCAATWYTLSWFPRIRSWMLRCLGRCICGGK